jgi:hypothetical protein
MPGVAGSIVNNQRLGRVEDQAALSDDRLRRHRESMVQTCPQPGH